MADVHEELTRPELPLTPFNVPQHARLVAHRKWEFRDATRACYLGHQQRFRTVTQAVWARSGEGGTAIWRGSRIAGRVVPYQFSLSCSQGLERSLRIIRSSRWTSGARRSPVMYFAAARSSRLPQRRPPGPHIRRLQSGHSPLPGRIRCAPGSSGPHLRYARPGHRTCGHQPISMC